MGLTFTIRLPGWRNGRRRGLKSRCPSGGVRVRIPLRVFLGPALPEELSFTNQTGEPVTSDRPHKGWVRFLTILVGFLTVLAILSTWVDRQIFDSQEWGQTSLEMLQDPAIQEQVAAFAVDELYANVDVEAELEEILPGDLGSLSGVAAGGLRQVADQGAKQALNNPQVQNLWEQANVTANETLVALIEDDGTVLSTSGGQVTLELKPLIVEIADQVGLGQQARDNIPDSVGQVEIVDSDQLSSVQTAATLIHGAALISALLGLALIGLAVYLSPGYRWLTLIWVAGALIIGAVIVLILRSVLGGLLVPELATPEVQPAADAAYGIATGLLRSIAMNVIWGALLLIPLAWLVSPTKSGESARSFLAVPFGRYPGATFALLGLVAFIFLLMGAGDQRGFLVRLTIVSMAGVAAYLFRQRLVEAYPDAGQGGFEDLGGRLREKADAIWAKRPTSLPGRGGKDAEGSAGPGAAPGPPEADTAQLPTQAQTEVLSAAGETDSEDSKWDRLERLAGMRDRGILTEEEFAEEKRRLMGGGE